MMAPQESTGDGLNGKIGDPVPDHVAEEYSGKQGPAQIQSM